MTDANGDSLVLRDPQGRFHIVPVAALARWRVSDERQAELERILPDDVTGFQALGLMPGAAPSALKLDDADHPTDLDDTTGASWWLLP